MKFTTSLLLFAFLALVPQNAYSEAYPLVDHSVPTPHRLKMGAPAVGDIDQNPANGREIVVGTEKGRVLAYRGDGVLLWSYQIPRHRCGGSTIVRGAPSLGSLLGDGVTSVVVSYGGGCNGGVVALRGSDGALQWNFNVRDFSRQAKLREKMYGVVSSPALADTDGDGTLEIGFGTFSRYAFLLEANGTPRFYYHTADTVWSSAAFDDVNGDGRKEMILGTDFSGDRKKGGYIYAFKTEIQAVKKFKYGNSAAFLWRRWFDQVMYSSPAVADLIPENSGNEIVIGSGCYFPSKAKIKNGAWFKVLSASDGTVLRTLSTPSCGSSSPAVADLNGDGQLDVVAYVNGSRVRGQDKRCRVMAWDPRSSSVLWEQPVPSTDRCAEFRSPIVADLDGNGSLEVGVGRGYELSVFRADTGERLTGDRGETDKPRIKASESVVMIPAAADLNNDGVLDVVLGSNAGLDIRTRFSFLTAGGSASPFSAPWPVFRGNERRSGTPP